MTNNIPNMSGYTPNYSQRNESSKVEKAPCSEECSPKCDCNLDLDPNSSIGRSMVQSTKKVGEYKYDETRTIEDAKTYEYVMEFAKGLKDEYMANGFDEKTAAQKASAFAYELLAFNE